MGHGNTRQEKTLPRVDSQQAGVQKNRLEASSCSGAPR